MDERPDTAPGPDAADDLALFRAEPRLLQRLRRLRLGSFPTPVQPFEINGRTILVKRDDRCADGYAGNKVRKLEFLLADALRGGARRVITAGAAGSHHALATAWHGTRLGLDASLVLFPQRLTPHVRDIILMDAATGAELRWVRRMEAVPWGMWRARRAHRGDAPYSVPPGGSSPVGALGYVSAGLELAEQIASGEAPRPDRIHVAAGTLGTVAGMAVGLAWAGLDIPITATRITSRVVTNPRVLGRLARDTVALLRAAGASLPPADSALRLIELQHDQIGDGYGRATAAGDRATELFAVAGLTLDATYTAKAAAGLLAGPADGLPLFWHTLSAVEPRDLLAGAVTADLPAPVRRYIDATRPAHARP
ncbi:MAG TPA: pyridoxal-phosphate dependent enzyme [Longimicrobiales bacterium]|nr:pyridoxal-phosphate dependent enzyme [Longimicrobiales bacterium]